MAVQKIQVDQFLSLAKDHPVFDVRSPSEYLHAYIPSAYSLPLFNDEERKVVGTIYKQESKQKAIKAGLDYFGVKMRAMVEKVEEIVAGFQLHLNTNDSDREQKSIVLVHCWRGGMRSGAVAWLLDLYGYKVYTLAGGYKAFRNWVLHQFEQQYTFKIMGGYTGSGKTVLLHEMKRSGKPVIDLEALANHKGSAFGALGQKPQPSQEMFENLLAVELAHTASSSLAENAPEGVAGVWLEDESQRVGLINIPVNVWQQMRNAPVYFIDIPFEERLKYITASYGTFPIEKLVDAVHRIQKRLGGLETTNAINHLLQGNIKEGFSILLRYYDKCYTKGLHNRSNPDALLYKIPCQTVSTNNLNVLYRVLKDHLNLLSH